MSIIRRLFAALLAALAFFDAAARSRYASTTSS
jgi:hypothetical protein